jgi:hypothetical protein
MSRLMSEPVKTFSLGFDGDRAYDETEYARVVADRFKTQHTEFRVSPSAIDLIDTLIWHHDGPFGDSSAVPTYIVSKLTREQVTVVLTGDGGDELFAGYLRFYAAVLAERVPARPAYRAAHGLLSRLPASAAIVTGSRAVALLPVARFAALRPDDALERVLLRRPRVAVQEPDVPAGLAPIDKLRHIAAERPPDGRPVHARPGAAREFHVVLADDLLVKTDRCTMANSLEARSPFSIASSSIRGGVAGPPEAGARTDQSRSARSVSGSAAAAGQTPRQNGLRRAPRRLVPRRSCATTCAIFCWRRSALSRHAVGPVRGRPRRTPSRRSIEPPANALGRQCFERWLRLLPDWTHGGRSGLLAARLIISPATASRQSHR